MKKTPIVVITILCMMMFVSGTVFAADTNFKDMPAENTWNGPALQKAVDNDLLVGLPDNTIQPSGSMDRAQMASIMCRAFGAPAGDNAYLKDFVDINTKAWYYTNEKKELAKAVEMELLFGNEKKQMNPSGQTTREESFAVIARAFKLEPLDAQETAKVLAPFVDADEVSAWAAPTAAALVKAGCVQGFVVKGERHLAPQAILSRSEFAVMMDQLVTVYVDNQSEVPTEDVAGNVVVRVGDVTFGAITIDGDLILGEGVGDADVILNGTKITGDIVVRAGEAKYVATKVVGIEKAIWSNTATPNAENVNKFMDSLWAKDSVFAAEGTTLTVNTDKITDAMLTFINTNWGGSTVPVALTFDGTVVKGADADANWSNSVLYWVDLKDLSYNEKATMKVGDDALTFDVDYVGGYATHVMTLAQPKWTAKTVNADDVNDLMAALWDAENGVFAVDGTALTIDCDKITDDMKTKIAAYWGGASVPVKLVINGDKMKSGASDKNWDNAFVDWINLDDAVMNGTVERAFPNNKNFKYTVTYTEGKDFVKYFDTLAQPKWTAKTDNADEVNALMAELWDADNGVFEADEATLIIHSENITESIKTKINTAWGGSSVPVKLVFDAENAIAKGLTRDANWDNAYLDWINLDDTKVLGTVTREIPNSADAYAYTVIYDRTLNTLEKPVWNAANVDDADKTNALMAALWDSEKPVFVAEDATLTIYYKNFTDDMKAQFEAIAGLANYSVPVALVFDEGYSVKDAVDANWSDASLDWINLDDATSNATVTRIVPNTLVDYTVVYSDEEYTATK